MKRSGSLEVRESSQLSVKQEDVEDKPVCLVNSLVKEGIPCTCVSNDVVGYDKKGQRMLHDVFILPCVSLHISK